MITACPVDTPTSSSTTHRHGRIRFVRPAAGGLATLGAVTVVVWSFLRGGTLQRSHPELKLGAAPLVGRDPIDGWHWRFGPGLAVAIGLATALVIAVRSGATLRCRLRVLIAVGSLGAAAFAVVLALTDGADGLFHGAADRTEYVANLGHTPPASAFVRTFLTRLDGYSVHVRGHPPGFVLVLKALAGIGLRGAWPAVALAVGSCAVIVAAVAITVHAVSGPDAVRRVVPFLVAVPYALWLVTSADAFFAATGAAATALLVTAIRSRRAAGVIGLTAGLLLGSLLFLTYLGALFLVVPAAATVAAWPKRSGHPARALAGAGLGIAAVVLGFRIGGFWWLDGLHRTQTEYWEGTAQFRSWGYFGWSDLAVALVALGPAVFGGLLSTRDRRLAVLTGGAVIGLLAAHLSPYTRGVVERIWLPFYPWIAVATAALGAGRTACDTGQRRRVAARWLTVQSAAVITLQAVLVSKW